MNPLNAQAAVPVSLATPPASSLVPSPGVYAHTLRKRTWCRVGELLLGYDGQLADRVSYCLIQLDPAQKFGRQMRPLFVGFGADDDSTAIMANAAEIELVSGTANQVALRIRTYLRFQRNVLPSRKA